MHLRNNTFLVVVWLTIGFRIAAFVKSPIANLPSDDFMARAIDVLQITALSLSLASNLSAIAVVGATARSVRFMDPRMTSSRHVC